MWWDPAVVDTAVDIMVSLELMPRPSSVPAASRTKGEGSETGTDGRPGPGVANESNRRADADAPIGAVPSLCSRWKNRVLKMDPTLVTRLRLGPHPLDEYR